MKRSFSPTPAHARSAKENAFSEADKQRFKKRTIVEQLNGRLKDEFGGALFACAALPKSWLI